MTHGTVFDIKEFTVHDGPGPRVTVFMKGCPLRCRWCHNPEGLEAAPQIMIRHASCVKCGECKKGCTHPECAGFDRCLHACPMGLIEKKGEYYDAGTLAKKLLSYKPFLKDGGITFSGGEPLMQAEFVCEVLTKLCGIHRAIETSGYADAATFKKVISHCELVMMDIKLANRDRHFEYTGVYNDKILENFKVLKSSGVPYIIRVPLIPSVTDTEENLTAISDIVGDSPVELLRFNKAAGAKYPMLGKKFDLEDMPNSKVDIKIFKNAIIL